MLESIDLHIYLGYLSKLWAYYEEALCFIHIYNPSHALMNNFNYRIIDCIPHFIDVETGG